MNDLFDTPAYKLARKNDPETSKQSAEQLDVNYWEKKVLETIKAFGEVGCISDDVLHAMSEARYSTVTARYKQLKEKNLVKVDHRKRKADSGRQQFIMWATEYYREDINALPEVP
jgi:hypothetical protein